MNGLPRLFSSRTGTAGDGHSLQPVKEIACKNNGWMDFIEVLIHCSLPIVGKDSSPVGVNNNIFAAAHTFTTSLFFKVASV